MIPPVHKFHPAGVRETIDRKGAIYQHVVTGPEGPVYDHLVALTAPGSCVQFYGAVRRPDGSVRIVVHRTVAPVIAAPQ
jgi:hypothetical protein